MKMGSPGTWREYKDLRALSLAYLGECGSRQGGRKQFPSFILQRPIPGGTEETEEGTHKAGLALGSSQPWQRLGWLAVG